MNRDQQMLEEMIAYYGKENIPNPEQYPIRFAFLTKSFEHYKRMGTRNEVVSQ